MAGHESREDLKRQIYGLMTERDKLKAERDKLKARVAALEEAIAKSYKAVDEIRIPYCFLCHD